MRKGPVFYDPGGRRQRVFSRGARVVAVALAVVSTIFIASIFGVSLVGTLSSSTKPHHGVIPTVKRPNVPSGLVTGKIRAELIKEVASEHTRQTKSPDAVQRIVGFYTGDDAGFNSLTNNIQNLTHFMPQWLKLTTDGSSLDLSDFDLQLNPRNAAIINTCQKSNVLVVPVLTNFSNGHFSSAIAHKFLNSPIAEKKVAGQLLQLLVTNSLAGINIDIENLTPADKYKLPDFLKILRSVFASRSLLITSDIETETPEDVMRDVSSPCDFVILMAYDEHDEGGEAGPIASANFVQNSLRRMLKVVPVEKVTLGIGAYSLDWFAGKSGGASTETYQEALTTAQGYLDQVPPSKAITFDEDSLNNTFTYQDENDKDHEVWMQDAATAYNSWSLGRDFNVRGFAVWALGQEDPSIWKFLDRQSTEFSNPVENLTKVDYPYEVENIGKGELLTVRQQQKEGSRKLDLDDSSGLITDCIYNVYPSPFVIQHRGYREKYVALTFDDGPDPKYTPGILDILKRKGIHATFFSIGENAEENPRLLERIYNEGHEIGSHTFFHPNLALFGQRRIELELNATQRSIQSITGHSTILFRPPYNADRDPASRDEVYPIQIAAAMGYITVGESTDPLDWDPYKEDPISGQKRLRTVQDIIDDTMLGVAQNDVPDSSNRDGGNCILLHDAGGDRTKTIAALPAIIDQLEAKGYKFVTVSELNHMTRDDVMPLPSPRDRFLIDLDKFAFASIFTFLQLLAIAFLSAITLGLLRIVIIVPLALVYERRQRKRIFSPDFQPPVSVIIAAYNEAQVIVRTIETILDSEYPIEKVIMVDDGSKDGTAGAVREVFGDNPLVKIIVQENTGKSGALEHAMHECETEIFVSVDADTQLRRDAIGLLVRHMEDERVGAVAGNVQVGNQMNVVTIWQGIEYTTSQNMDRRAYGLLNCITVVPGAIGAWRKSAVTEVGGHQDDTLAEDMDLTWRLRKADWKLETESEAMAFTEAPDNIKAFFKQRFRWSYGTLQCLAKHRKAVFKYGFFGRVALPGIWLFQIVFQAIAPLVDLQIVISLIGFGFAVFYSHSGNQSQEVSPLAQSIANLQEVGLLYAIFFLVEVIAGMIAYRLERKKFGTLWWLFLQRFAYRQIMYAVVYKSLRTALRGARQGWGKLDRKASVKF